MTIPQIAASERVAPKWRRGRWGRSAGRSYPWRAAFDYRRDQRLHLDGGADPVRAGEGRAVFRAVRRGASAVSDARAGDRLRRSVDGDSGGSGRTKRCIRTTILAAWIFYTMSVAAVLVLRRKLPDAARPYRMWGYPWTLWLFVASSVWFIADAS